VSRTDRREPREPQERQFPYVPRCPIVITGARYTAEENAANIRSLLGPDLGLDMELEALSIISMQGR
jgi:hypothetical protein